MVDDTNVDRPSSCRNCSFSCLTRLESSANLAIRVGGRCDHTPVQGRLRREHPRLGERAGDDLQPSEEGGAIGQAMPASRVGHQDAVPFPPQLQHRGEPAHRVVRDRHAVPVHMTVLAGLPLCRRRTRQPVCVRRLHEPGWSGRIVAGPTECGILQESAAIHQMRTPEAPVGRRLDTTHPIVHQRTIGGLTMSDGRVAGDALQSRRKMAGVAAIIGLLTEREEHLGTRSARVGRGGEGLRLRHMTIATCRCHIADRLRRAGQQQPGDQNM